MDKRIPRINQKLYQTPRARFIANHGGMAPQITGRSALYQNQYSRKTPTASYRYAKIAIIVIAVFLLMQSIFQIPQFRITDVRIQGLKYIPLEQVQSFIMDELHRRRLFIFRNDNYFLLAQTKMRKRLEQRFYLTVTSLHVSFPHTVTISVHERITAFVVQTPDGYFTLGTDGKALETVDKPQPNQLLIADERAVKERSIPVDYLEKATTIAEDWGQSIQLAALTGFHLTDDKDRIIVSTDKGFRVYVDPNKDIHPQLQRLSVYLQDRNFEAPAEYIDLRYDDNVYLK